MLTRRAFLSGLTGAAGVAVYPGPGSRWPRKPEPVAPAAEPGDHGDHHGDGVLVVVTLDGGNDGLGTVAPVDDPAYRAARGALALDPATAHPIGEGFALHPALAGLAGEWAAGRLAVVHGVGFAGLDRSHPHCADVWQAADEHDLTTGLLGRWLDLAGDDPLQAVAVGDRLPLLVRGRRRSGVAVPAGPVVLAGGPGIDAALAGLAAPDAGRTDLGHVAARSVGDLLHVVDATAAPLAGAGGGDGLAAKLDVVARLIGAGLPTRAFAVGLGGFDTHANQAPAHAALLGELDAALVGFLDAVTGADRPVTVVVHSEFGRRVAANASGGTDHGAAGAVLLAGRVVAGHHGEPPPLADLDRGDLRTTVDFRSVWGGLLGGVLGVEAHDVLGHGAPAPLTLV